MLRTSLAIVALIALAGPDQILLALDLVADPPTGDIVGVDAGLEQLGDGVAVTVGGLVRILGESLSRLADAAGEEVCLPEPNRPDVARWAFMKWATQHYDRRGEPAAEGVWAMLHDVFACQ